jgi:hypothetical protein
LYVQKKKVYGIGTQIRYGLRSVFALRYELHVVVIRQQGAKQVPPQRLVIDYDRS